ncbi:conserved hypothetical protein YidD [Gleimia coleocanis DSM 15436]|uniref:Putative membrane protein insertion efficiency factor n=1 Tax=Gleimia coleocanis DSM 15436 TaxID=525245 RepID=C0VY00_9ACTO|nr:membrane protein insertion efficiency factor YidD [Gleimia coleocanis]EEH64303.1 conserved hypothetical protein YidD [Gleimia coleocanis DSM 15436]
MNILTKLLTAPIRFYQLYISPAFPPRCRYYPSCSTYAVEAIKVHGPIKGLILGTYRLLRCNPWSLGGVDHVPDVGKWKPKPYVRPTDEDVDTTSTDE